MSNIKLICDWRSLFQYAGEAGKAKMAYKENPTDHNKKLMEDAIERHDRYRDICLEADEMIGLNMRDL